MSLALALEVPMSGLGRVRGEAESLVTTVTALMVSRASKQLGHAQYD